MIPKAFRAHHESPIIMPRYSALESNRALVEVLVAEKLTTQEAIRPLLEQLQYEHAAKAQEGHAVTLLQLLVDEKVALLDDLLGLVVEKSGLPYLPLSTYDIDPDIIGLLPKEIEFEYSVIPFDLISRSVLIATANPFDAVMRDQIRSLIDYDLFWYVGSPLEIAMALRHAHGMDTDKSGAAKT